MNKPEHQIIGPKRQPPFLPHGGLAACCLIVGLLLTACDTDDGTVPALGTLERDRIELVADSNEPIVHVLVREGDAVVLGAVLVEQDASRAEVALAKANAEQATALAALSEAEQGPRQQEIAAARARLAAAASAVKTARFELSRELTLVARKLASQNRVDLLRGHFDEAVAHKNEAKAVLDQLLEGTRSEEIDQARSHHAAALANVKNLQITVARAAITAPVAGVIEALPFEVGERPPPGATVVVVLASGRIYARVHVSAPLRAQLRPHERAQVWLDGRELPLPGTLRWIAAAAAFTPYFALNQHDRSRLSYLAEVDLQDNTQALPIGVPVEVTFPDIGADVGP